MDRPVTVPRPAARRSLAAVVVLSLSSAILLPPFPPGASAEHPRSKRRLPGETLEGDLELFVEGGRWRRDFDGGVPPRQTGLQTPDTARQSADPDDLLFEARRENLPGAGFGSAVDGYRSVPARLLPHGREFRVDRRRGGHYRAQIAPGQAMLSPAAAEGKVFLGGGFKSREVHCLEAATGRTRWTVELADNGPASPAYSNGVVVYNTESCSTYALDAGTGRMLWSRYLGAPLIAMPTIADGYVLVSHPESRPTVERPPDGLSPRELRAWYARRTASRPRTARPQKGYRVSAFDLKSGTLRWQKWIDQHVISAPVVSGQDVFLVTFAGTLYKLRLTDGEIMVARRCRATSAPAIGDDAVFLTCRREDDGAAGPTESILKLDRLTGSPVCCGPPARADYLRAEVPKPPRGRRPRSVPPSMTAPAQTVGRYAVQSLQEYSGSRLLLFEGRLFGCMGPALLCSGADYGHRQWSVRLGSAEYDPREMAAGPPAFAGGSLFVATLGGDLLQVARATGTIQRRVHVRAPVITEPIVERGRVFLGTRDGQLVCVDFGDEEMTGWSQWGGTAARCGPPPAADHDQRLALGRRERRLP